MLFKSMVLSNHEVSPGYFRMRVTAPSGLLSASPGQFVMVKVRDSIDPLLRRPFGIFDIGVLPPAYDGGCEQIYLEILYKVVGKGTAMMATLHNGDALDFLAPLGRGFDLGNSQGEKVLVGGGIGLAPLYFLAKKLVENSKVRLFIGGRTREDILCVTEFERLGIETYVSTDDGTLGSCGLVTEALDQHLAEVSMEKTIFTCGPMPMLEAVAEIARHRSIPCQVSLEAHMACGMGACLGCVVKGSQHADSHPDYRCVCKEGPVFDFQHLMWV